MREGGSPKWAGRSKQSEVYLVLPYWTAATFTVGGVCEATGSMVSVLSSTAARTSAESCGRRGGGCVGEEGPWLGGWAGRLAALCPDPPPAW